jgi:transglutaminase-like putative cysteine protease
MNQELYRLLARYGASYGTDRIVREAGGMTAAKRSVIYGILTQAADALPDNASNAQRLRLLYEALRRGIRYCPSEPFPAIAYTFSGALRGEAVCEGIAELFQVCCMAAGITSEIVVGSIGGKTESLHAWTAVTLEGKTYFTDLTSDLTATRGFGEPRLFLRGDDFFNSLQYQYRKDQYPAIYKEDHPYVTVPYEAIKLYADFFRDRVFARAKEIIA